jgi:hypothetical protein
MLYDRLFDLNRIYSTSHRCDDHYDGRSKGSKILQTNHSLKIIITYKEYILFVLINIVNKCTNIHFCAKAFDVLLEDKYDYCGTIFKSYFVPKFYFFPD